VQWDVLIFLLFIFWNILHTGRSQWPSCIRRGFAATRLLGLRVRSPLWAWMSVSYECCVLSGRSIFDGPITRPGESYRLWCVILCDLETLRMSWPWPSLGCCSREKQIRIFRRNLYYTASSDVSIRSNSWKWTEVSSTQYAEENRSVLFFSVMTEAE
jgi:hypothetical protein